MIVNAISQGLALGLFLAIQPGPSFFALLQTGSKMGFKPGFGLAIGIILSDLSYVVLSYLGIAQLFDNEENQHFIGIAGGIILIIFGLKSLLQKQTTRNKIEEINAISMPLYIVKGFFLNFLNPAVFLLWILFVGKVSSNPDFSQANVILFFSVTLSTVFFADTLKAYYANKISRRLSNKVLHYINLLLGVILLVTGVVFIYKVLATFI